MTQVMHRRASGNADRSDSTPPTDTGLADWLHLAATPTFAVMPLLTAITGGEMTCMGMAGSSPLGSMGLMYLLMSAFHAAPWVRLASGRCGRERFQPNP